MIKQLGTGRYKTKTPGLIAVVARCKILGGEWRLVGACTDGSLAVLTYWTLTGVNEVDGFTITEEERRKASGDEKKE